LVRASDLVLVRREVSRIDSCIQETIGSRRGCAISGGEISQ
jgi:hypothetical protein